jgi:ABC-type polysaccharide/polyol phosphate transport system ATPase subunit
MMSELTMNDAAISVQDLTKIYKLYNSPADRLREALNPLRKKYHRDFYALNGVSFEVKKGETVGIIGQNGAGKSTLLKIITGVLTPSSGHVNVNGRISALLELGAGFNPDISGLENVYFNGTILGFSKEEMDAKLDDILSFADISDFIHQPVKIYSSGMFVRLAFAVAVHVEPEILIVDEALSVGDVMFQSKCFDKIKSLMDGGATTLFVTHNMNTVTTLCNRAMMIDGGKIHCQGSPKDVTLAYYCWQRERELARQKPIVKRSAAADTECLSTTTFDETSPRAQNQPGEERFGSGNAKIVDFRVFNKDGVETETLESGLNFRVEVNVVFKGDVKNPAVGIMLKSPQGQALMGIHTYHDNRIQLGAKKAGDRLALTLAAPMQLNPGKYIMNVGIADHETDLEYQNVDSRHNVTTITVVGKSFSYGLIHNPGTVTVNPI